MAEDVCINKFCGNGYDHTANKFPYIVTYSKFPTQYNTKFEFEVSKAKLINGDLIYVPLPYSSCC